MSLSAPPTHSAPPAALGAVYIVDAVRTPIGRFNGALRTVRPDDLAAHVLRALLARNPSLDPAAVEDVIFGAANQAGEDNRDVARMAALLAGLPVTVPGTTVNRLCASGLQAIIDATRALRCGDGDVYLAGGAESMTRAPFVLGKAETAFERQQPMFDTVLGWRFTNPKLAALYHPYTMGETAENVARDWHISREEQDQFAFESQSRYAAAHAAGRFQAELVPVPVPQPKGEPLLFEHDEHPRLSPVAKLAELKPAFKSAADGGTVTAGNASGLNDGAAAVLLVSEAALKQYNLTPLARVVSTATAGVDPAVMGIGPVPAVRKALARAGLTVADLDLVELNEAFASQSLACIRDLGLDSARVNVNGGAIALGHPIGASGARVLVTLIHEMIRRDAKKGLASLCIGGGMGVALAVERD